METAIAAERTFLGRFPVELTRNARADHERILGALVQRRETLLADARACHGARPAVAALPNTALMLLFTADDRYRYAEARLDRAPAQQAELKMRLEMLEASRTSACAALAFLASAARGDSVVAAPESTRGSPHSLCGAEPRGVRMKSPVEVARAVDAVERHERELESPDALWFSPLEVLIPFVREGTIDAMYAAMSRKLKRFFLSDARLQFWVFDATAAECIAGGEDPAGWIALREWLYHQPFDVDPSLPLPSPEEVNRLGIVRTFERILPHFATKSVDAVLDTLHPTWRRKNLPGFATGMRPSIDVILATCRAHGQDPTPFVKLMEWEATLPKA